MTPARPNLPAGNYRAEVERQSTSIQPLSVQNRNQSRSLRRADLTRRSQLRLTIKRYRPVKDGPCSPGPSARPWILVLLPLALRRSYRFAVFGLTGGAGCCARFGRGRGLGTAHLRSPSDGGPRLGAERWDSTHGAGRNRRRGEPQRDRAVRPLPADAARRPRRKRRRVRGCRRFPAPPRRGQVVPHRRPCGRRTAPGRGRDAHAGSAPAPGPGHRVRRRPHR